jgi:hypothetical protein
VKLGVVNKNVGNHTKGWNANPIKHHKAQVVVVNHVIVSDQVAEQSKTPMPTTTTHLESLRTEGKKKA